MDEPVAAELLGEVDRILSDELDRAEDEALRGLYDVTVHLSALIGRASELDRPLTRAEHRVLGWIRDDLGKIMTMLEPIS